MSILTLLVSQTFMTSIVTSIGSVLRTHSQTERNPRKRNPLNMSTRLRQQQILAAQRRYITFNVLSLRSAGLAHPTASPKRHLSL